MLQVYMFFEGWIGRVYHTSYAINNIRFVIFEGGSDLWRCWKGNLSTDEWTYRMSMSLPASFIEIRSVALCPLNFEAISRWGRAVDLRVGVRAYLPVSASNRVG